MQLILQEPIEEVILASTLIVCRPSGSAGEHGLLTPLFREWEVHDVGKIATIILREHQVLYFDAQYLDSP